MFALALECVVDLAHLYFAHLRLVCAVAIVLEFVLGLAHSLRKIDSVLVRLPLVCVIDLALATLVCGFAIAIDLAQATLIFVLVVVDVDVVANYAGIAAVGGVVAAVDGGDPSGAVVAVNTADVAVGAIAVVDVNVAVAAVHEIAPVDIVVVDAADVAVNEFLVYVIDLKLETLIAAVGGVVAAVDGAIVFAEADGAVHCIRPPTLRRRYQHR